MTDQQKELLAESTFIYQMTRKGYTINRPYLVEAPYDFVIEDKDHNLHRVKLNYTESGGTKIVVDTYSTPNVFDWLALFDVSSENVCYIPSERLSNLTKLKLRVTPTGAQDEWLVSDFTDRL